MTYPVPPGTIPMPYPPYTQPIEYPAPPVTNTTTFNLPSPERQYSAIIFTEVEDANDFMADAIVSEVIMQSLEGQIFITVFYEVEPT